MKRLFIAVICTLAACNKPTLSSIEKEYAQDLSNKKRLEGAKLRLEGSKQELKMDSTLTDDERAVALAETDMRIGIINQLLVAVTGNIEQSSGKLRMHLKGKQLQQSEMDQFLKDISPSQDVVKKK